ncbi:MAG: aminomethyl-transferring glycine dehydrogenase [Chitinophagales bacterium]|jgi:glycine dehydrogenase|nr:aminomethyl-transferring glycine dehydrogenase [Chitinophagales bacterium]
MKNIAQNFFDRHIGTYQESEILSRLSIKNSDEIITKTIPSKLLSQNNFDICEAMSESEYLIHIRNLAKENKVYKNFIGQGFYGTYTPSVILRNLFENPGWYTQYTPYQAEIAQGRLESLLNFQTMIADLTGMEIAGASLLDEATAAAEAMMMLHSLRNKSNSDYNTLIIDQNLFEATQSVIRSKAKLLGFDVKSVNIHEPIDSYEGIFGVIIQNPDKLGGVYDFSQIIATYKEQGILTAMICDIMSLTWIKTPSDMGAEIAIGNSQRFGVPMGFGGPHAAFLATKDMHKRLMPGRIIGVSKDRNGNHALRMALQTREQHIKRDRATSNICTAQALLANMAAMYAVYHGPERIQDIANYIYSLTSVLKQGLESMGYAIVSKTFFDTLTIANADITSIRAKAEAAEINFFYKDDQIRISLDETTQWDDVLAILKVFANDKNPEIASQTRTEFPEHLRRKTPILSHPIFNSYHSETQLMRYIKYLEDKDLSLTKSMIPLGSCTMKLNAATQLIPVSWPEFSQIHPFVPQNQVSGYLKVIETLSAQLSKITGFDGCSLQPNSGAQGEYAGLACIRDFQRAQGQEHRDIVLIPSSAHGTNPASAVLAGLKVEVTPCDDQGNIDIEVLRAKAIEFKDRLSCLMVTYPSTHGVYETGIQEICQIIHDNGGQVYMDGANMNAQVGYTSPGFLGADVCHLNLHKTFAIPHGGGGPGVGPICVKAHLVPFLPSHPFLDSNNQNATISNAPYGSASITLISYAYIQMLGSKGLKDATKFALINANYLKTKLQDHYPVLYTGQNDMVAHELILDFRGFKHSLGIEVEDIAKRLMDYGFHAPTVSFPVAGTLMIEPTESEDLLELDRFVEAMISIRQEIREIEEGKYPKDNNVLKNAPHTSYEATSDSWTYPYSRQKAVYPIERLKTNKFWPSVARVDNSYGDRNLVCSCLPLEAYQNS